MTTNQGEQCGACGVSFPTLAEVFSHDCDAIVHSNRPIGMEAALADRRGGSGSSGGNPDEAASLKQIDFLKSLGFEGDPNGLSKAQASAEIDRLLAARNAVKAAAPKVEAMGYEAAAEFVRSLGRKLEVADVTPELREFAHQWVLRMEIITFEFLGEMQAAAEKGALSVGQAKGVLNCFRADVLRSQPKPAMVVPASTYEPVKGDVHVVGEQFYRVHIGQNSGNAYAVVADVIRPAIWNEDHSRIVQAGEVEWNLAKGMIFRLSESTKATAAQAAAFGQLAGRCCFCTHEIDTPESTMVGYGPVCAAKMGLPWGNTTSEVN